MDRNQKIRQMEQIVRDAEMNQRELIGLLAMFLSDADPAVITEWFHEMKESRETFEKRTNELLAEWKKRDLERFDPII